MQHLTTSQAGFPWDCWSTNPASGDSELTMLKRKSSFFTVPVNEKPQWSYRVQRKVFVQD